MQQQTDRSFVSKIAEELQLAQLSVKAVIELFEGGNTIPFIARYRKEVTGNLDEVQIKAIQERHAYLKELEERRQTILTSIESQGKLTEGLRDQILQCNSKTTLEDLYLPYKPKRRTRAMIAREKGLEPLAFLMLEQSLDQTPLHAAQSYVDVNKGVDDVNAALAGARDIVAEIVAEDASIRALVRDVFANDGVVVSKVRSDKMNVPSKFEQYYDFKESVRTIPSHRYLAIRRGEKEEFLDFSITIESDPVINLIAKHLRLSPSSPWTVLLQQAIDDSFKRLLSPSVETDIRVDLKLASDHAAVAVFADNLRHLLLASPLGGRSVLGIDPGIRTGCKCAVVDDTGKYLESATIFLSQGEGAQHQGRLTLLKLIETYKPYAIAVGNGTAGRETESFIRKMLKEAGCTSTVVVPVNESGASIYSASETAREEFPTLDLTIRGAISIARRLQDPLAELVKIDPKSIGVGQYQHDVYQPLLQDQLQYVVESCVNGVGVDLNTASASLLSYVSGIGSTLAKKIVKYREENGAFRTRKQLREVSGFGAKTFEQAAGFLRIRNGDNPLDASAVHPERYDLVEQMAKDLDVPLIQLVANSEVSARIDCKRYVNQEVGELTLADIIQELMKPGRDPRALFEPPAFRDDITTMEDLTPGLRLEGIVTNVTAFGAFVDIGVHQYGLVHLSELSDKFIKHPSEVVKTGDKLKVEVLQVDIPRKRISLTARTGQKRQMPSESLPKQESHKRKALPPKPGFQSNPFASL